MAATNANTLKNEGYLGGLIFFGLLQIFDDISCETSEEYTGPCHNNHANGNRFVKYISTSS